MINEISQLFKEDLVFIEKGKDSSEIFNKVGKKLIERGLVRDNFIEEVIKREEGYPTGIDLEVVYNDEAGIPNVAIPHTETEYCNCKNVVVVKLEKDVEFKNMISPEKSLNVRFLFMILNNEKNAQTNILSNLMGFVTQLENMKSLCKSNSTKEIYDCIVKQ